MAVGGLDRGDVGGALVACLVGPRPGPRDGYVADLAKIVAEVGVPDPPRTEADLIAAYRAELAGTAQARAATRFLFLTPPLPAAARPPYAVLAAAAMSLLPGWPAGHFACLVCR